MTSAELERHLPPRLARWARHLTAAAALYELDALLLAAIMDRESLGGDALNPKGPDGTGDNGHGRGLMQIDDRTHRRFTDAADDVGRELWADPAVNVLYAARLLSRNLRSSDGDEDMAIAAYNAGMQRAFRATRNADPSGRRAALDAITTGRNYVSDVQARRAAFTSTTWSS